jgi:hypothetical protein
MLSRFWSDFVRPCFVRLAGLLQQSRERWHGYAIYGRVLLVFAASRLVVVIGVRTGTLLVRDPAPGKWDAGPNWYYRLLRWDSGWYADIIRRGGYWFDGDGSVQTSVTFFPGYPLLSSAVKSVFHVDEYIALLLVANISSLLAVLLFAKLARDELGDEIALSAVALFCFFPSSMFLSAGYTESLCLVFVLLSLILVTRQKFVLSSAIAGLAMATRPTSIVLAPVILWEMWRQNTLPLSRLLPRMALCGVLAVSGLIAFMIYLGVEFEHPLAFFTNQNAWSGERFRYRLLSAVTNPFRDLDWRYGAFWLGFLALMICSFRRLRPAVWLYGVGALAMPYLVQGGFIPSTDRFILMCVPGFMAMALLCKGRPWLTNALIGIFAALLLRKTALFSQWYWEG